MCLGPHYLISDFVMDVTGVSACQAKNICTYMKALRAGPPPRLQDPEKNRNRASKSGREIMQRRRFGNNFAARAPTQRGLGDTKDVTIDEAGTSGVGREVRELFFSGCGGFLADLGAPRLVQERPRDAKSTQKERKSEPRWMQKWCRARFLSWPVP